MFRCNSHFKFTNPTISYIDDLTTVLIDGLAWRHHISWNRSPKWFFTAQLKVTRNNTCFLSFIYFYTLRASVILLRFGLQSGWSEGWNPEYVREVVGLITITIVTSLILTREHEIQRCVRVSFWLQHHHLFLGRYTTTASLV